LDEAQRNQNVAVHLIKDCLIIACHFGQDKVTGDGRALLLYGVVLESTWAVNHFRHYFTAVPIKVPLRIEGGKAA
jgi:hypothetical protein